MENKIKTHTHLGFNKLFSGSWKLWDTVSGAHLRYSIGREQVFTLVLSLAHSPSLSATSSDEMRRLFRPIRVQGNHWYGQSSTPASGRKAGIGLSGCLRLSPVSRATQLSKRGNRACRVGKNS
jgi:hypothetical protein